VAVDGDGRLAGVRPRPRRGDIFCVALDPTRGTEIRKEELEAVDDALRVTLGLP
jgi:hypothetical protein